MGFLPLVKNMPLPITATDPRNKSILFRANTVYSLDGHCTRKTKRDLPMPLLLRILAGIMFRRMKQILFQICTKHN